MSGWLETLPSKRIRAVYRDADGHRHSQTFPTRREARAFLTATLAEAIQHRLGNASIVMTMDRYGHLLEDVDEELIAGLERQLSGA